MGATSIAIARQYTNSLFMRGKILRGPRCAPATSSKPYAKCSRFTAAICASWQEGLLLPHRQRDASGREADAEGHGHTFSSLQARRVERAVVDLRAQAQHPGKRVIQSATAAERAKITELYRLALQIRVACRSAYR